MRHCGIYCPFAGFINIFISVKQKKKNTHRLAQPAFGLISMLAMNLDSVKIFYYFLVIKMHNIRYAN